MIFAALSCLQEQRLSGRHRSTYYYVCAKTSYIRFNHPPYNRKVNKKHYSRKSIYRLYKLFSCHPPCQSSKNKEFPLLNRSLSDKRAINKSSAIFYKTSKILLCFKVTPRQREAMLNNRGIMIRHNICTQPSSHRLNNQQS